jgi:energy-coupling factor transporter ATP-binding protein EcfA2
LVSHILALMKATSAGARFYKTDLHTHTPASKDYVNKGASPEDIVRAAQGAGIEILAITDHNAADWIERVTKAAVGAAVTVIPGAEITTPEGHILALFDPGHDPSRISDLLVEVGIPREKHGKEDAISTSHAEEVIRKIHASSGIAAHANESNGLLKTKGQYKLKLVPMPELAAIELTKQDEIGRFSQGKVSPDYPPKACTYSSDSHDLTEIGRRAMYLKMDGACLRGIRQALLDYRLRVRFPWDYKQSTHPRILSLTVDQGFFEGQRFEFHENLNCLVGGQGTGKSTVVELLRYCFEDVSEVDTIRDDHLGKIQSLLGDGGTVTVEYLDSDGELKIIRREMQPWPTEREVKDPNGNMTSIETSPAFFSQGELLKTAASPLAQLDLLDRRLDLENANREEAEAIDSLRVNAQELIAGTERITRLEAEIKHPETGKTATEARYKQLERHLKEAVLKEFPVWEAEQRYLGALKASIEALPEHFDTAIDDIDLRELEPSPPPDSPNLEQIKRVANLGEKVKDHLKKAKTDFRLVVAELSRAVNEVLATIQPHFEAKKTQHDQALEGLGQGDIRKANAQLRSLGKRLETLRQNEGELIRLNEEVQDLKKARTDLRQKLTNARTERWKKRAGRAQEYQSRLSGVVKVAVVLCGDRTEFEKRIRELSRRGYLKEPEINRLAARLDPQSLGELVLKRDVDGIVKKTGVTEEVARRVVDSILEKGIAEIYELETVDLADQPEVSYAVAQDRWKILRELSTGQKGTVIIELAMVEGSGPLVIDQPEEPLDTQSIYGQVVTTLRKSKEERQFVFTTHNPNVAVGADAELSHILDATADKGAIQSSGAVDHEKTNRLLLVHLEGGQEALDLRVKKYNLGS